ncbi:RRP12-like protein [Nerophis ophidion]|uniref:RRP12-like protein n=1 Tax=Nerophis ophidion TaxID=159077 RepID=UPI002AE07082|nr:RRP12-like protein [Nerophis ophidion]
MNNSCGVGEPPPPERKKSSKADHGFKVTSDGRLIIKEDDDEDAKQKDGEIKDILEEVGVKSKKSQKRKLEDERLDNMDIEPELKYKGTQRPLSIYSFFLHTSW